MAINPGYGIFLGGPLHGQGIWMKELTPKYRFLFVPPEKPNYLLPYADLKTAIYNYTPCREGNGPILEYYVFEEIYDGRV